MIRRSPRPEYGFTVIDNATLRDTRLSWRARGLLAYILSLPDDWTVTSSHLESQGTEGREAIRASLRELEAAGYMTRYRYARPNGTFGWETIVYDHPFRRPVQEPVDEPEDF